MDNSVARIKEVKDRWKLDTIVLDAGHGGKDPGTMGPRGTKEKDIALDITKRIGLLLEKNTKLKVIYTREEDIFIPLWKRTRIANESNGKMFLSIHCFHAFALVHYALSISKLSILYANYFFLFLKYTQAI